jgi:hypothetical protein
VSQQAVQLMKGLYLRLRKVGDFDALQQNDSPGHLWQKERCLTLQGVSAPLQ